MSNLIEHFADQQFVAGQYVEHSDDEDDLDFSADPFEILARKEERAGISLIHMSVDHDD